MDLSDTSRDCSADEQSMVRISDRDRAVSADGYPGATILDALSEFKETELEVVEKDKGEQFRSFVSNPTPTRFGDLESLPAGSSGSLTKSSGRSRKKKKKATSGVLVVNPDNVAASIKNGLFRPSKQETEALATIKDLYSKVLKFRDYYFDHFSLERAAQRNSDVAQVVSKLVAQMDQLAGKCRCIVEDFDEISYVCSSLQALRVFLWGLDTWTSSCNGWKPPENSASCIFKHKNLPWFHAYRALCLSVDSRRAEESHLALQNAVRHLAHLPVLWVALGESYWDLSDHLAAVSCFEKAALLDRNDAIPLVKLSLSMRLLLSREPDQTEKCKMLLRMVKLAREAIAKAPENGETWYNFGNALLVYFNVKAHAGLIVETLDAFKKASACRVLQGKADFHYNYGTAHLLSGNYQDALLMWKRAIALEPDWKVPQERMSDLLRYLVFISDLVSGKERTFRRRVKQLAESVPMKNLSAMLQEAGPGLYQLAHVKDLKDGRNERVVAHGKIYITSYQTPDPSKLVFLVDSTAESIPVVIYNIGVDFSLGGSVSIPDPVVCTVDIKHDEKAIQFRYIRVDEPWKMFHNLIKVPRNVCAQTVVVTAPIPRPAGSLPAQ